MLGKSKLNDWSDRIRPSPLKLQLTAQGLIRRSEHLLYTALRRLLNQNCRILGITDCQVRTHLGSVVMLHDMIKSSRRVQRGLKGLTQVRLAESEVQRETAIAVESVTFDKTKKFPAKAQRKQFDRVLLFLRERNVKLTQNQYDRASQSLL